MHCASTCGHVDGRRWNSDLNYLCILNISSPLGVRSVVERTYIVPTQLTSMHYLFNFASNIYVYVCIGPNMIHNIGSL